MFSSVAGSAPSSRRPPSIPGGSPKKPPKLYRPSIYTYTCHGYYFAASDANDGSEGVCKGLRSQLEVLDNPELMTRAEALKRFSTVSTDFPPQEQGEQIQQTIYMSPVLVFQDKTKTTNESDKIPSEDYILRETFTCYGSTEVEYLVLQDTELPEKRQFVAVGPRNTGVSIREIETDDSVRHITRIGLGVLDIIHDSNTMTSHDEDDLSRRLEEVPERPPPDALNEAKQSLLYCYDFSRKVAEHMQINATWLYQNLQDDFPRRTYHAGTRIVAELPRICEKTAQNMGNILRRMMGDDFDGED